MIPVVFSSDHNFIMPTYIAIESMLANSSRQCEVYLLVADDVTDTDKKLLQEMIERYGSHVRFVAMDSTFDNTFIIRGISKATYFRLLIPWILPDCKKVIYLDGDIIVNGDIASLYDYAFDESHLICGVRTPGYSTNGGLRKKISSIGLVPEEYINAGILIINCERLRAENFKTIFLNHIDKKYFFQDQDILNITCKGRVGYLPLKFNFREPVKGKILDQYLSKGIAEREEVSEAENSPVIIHYSGPKPWKDFTFRWTDWVEYYKLSPFYNQELIDRITYKTLYPDFNLKKTIKTLTGRV